MPALVHPDWAKNVSIYQLNTRQFTPEGTLAAAQQHLPRIQKLGCDLVWLMPVNPIGQQNRKGSLGSPYSVCDYFSVNPELGTLADLRAFVDAAHQRGMHVILDWVANHTSWDHPLTLEHPEWYLRDWKGDFAPTHWWDWEDIIELDYTQQGVRDYMIEAMAYWVRQAGVDGFRCDVAGFVPTDFWEQARARLRTIKPELFMLAEWESRELHHEAFNMTYALTWVETMGRIARGQADVGQLRIFYSWDGKAFPGASMRMMMVSNHDLNAWEGTEFERLGPALEAAMALSVLGRGMPLVYSGQEAGNEKRLAFFERDPIVWRDHPNGQLYRTLLHLKKNTSVLWNGPWGAPMINVANSCPQHVLSFVRRNAEHQIFAVFNFSDQPLDVQLREALYPGTYTDILTGEQVKMPADHTLPLPPWAWWAGIRQQGQI